MTVNHDFDNTIICRKSFSTIEKKYNVGKIDLILMYFLFEKFDSSERPVSGNDIFNTLQFDPSLIMSAKENVVATIEEELRPIPPRRLPPIPEDKLHRVNILFLNYFQKFR